MRPDISDKIENGWIHIRNTLEVQGNDTEIVKKSLENMVSRLEKEEGVILLNKKFDEMREIEKKWYSDNAEIELLVKGVDRLIYIVVTYPPTTLEIIQPMEIKAKAFELQSALLDAATLINTFSNALNLQQRDYDAKQKKALEEFKKISGKQIL